MFNIYFKEMKKFFSLIALVGVIAACTPEQVQTAFSLAGGKILVNVELVDVINGGTYSGPVDIQFTRGGLNITNEFQSIVGGGPHSYMWQAEESKPVAAGDYGIVVKGAKLAKDYTSAFVFPEVMAGGEAVIKVIVPVGEPLNGWTIDVDYDEDKVVETEESFFLDNEDYPTYQYSYEGIDTWYVNNSEYLLEGTANYELSKYDDTVSNVVDHEYLGFEGIVGNVVDYYSDPNVYPRTYDFFVSAWAMWNVVQTNYRIQAPFTVFAFKDANKDEEYNTNEEYLELGTFDLDEVLTAGIECVELPYPEAARHYHAGHGQDAHGNKPNAGGGISYNE
jgi:hypothetical protein